jgi:uncharacterized protein YndB with AHSA1/START domain
VNANAIEATSAMLIRKPVAQVFEAFINPDITRNFWFTKSSGKLEAGAKVSWQWEMYGANAHVDVLEIEENKRILIQWDEGDKVEWLFTERADNETYVTITNNGFRGTEEEIVQKALDSVGGFTTVLAGLKAWLEHGINLNLIADKYPDAIVKS